MHNDLPDNFVNNLNDIVNLILFSEAKSLPPEECERYISEGLSIAYEFLIECKAWSAEENYVETIVETDEEEIVAVLRDNDQFQQFLSQQRLIMHGYNLGSASVDYLVQIMTRLGGEVIRNEEPFSYPSISLSAFKLESDIEMLNSNVFMPSSQSDDKPKQSPMTILMKTLSYGILVLNLTKGNVSSVMTREVLSIGAVLGAYGASRLP